jgi:predicted O-methyltransferase YrrM
VQRLTRILRPVPGQKTRFHTERGQLLPLSGWLRMPAALGERLRSDPPAAPWLAPAVVAFLRTEIKPDWTIFEFGGGTSTGWYAKRARKVVTVEDDLDWHGRVKRQLVAQGVMNCDLSLRPLADFPDFLASLAEPDFDVIIVDNNEGDGVTRLDCLRAAKGRVRPGGLLLLDDSDWPHLRHAHDLVPDWEARRFVGIKSVPFRAVETTVFVRPAEVAV